MVRFSVGTGNSGEQIENAVAAVVRAVRALNDQE